MKIINDFIAGVLRRLRRSAGSVLNWVKDLNSVKIIAMVVVNCFLLTSVYGQAVAAVSDNVRAAQQFKQIFEDFNLPYSYGKITSSDFAGSDTVVINIQDLHSHAEVQRNISKIIDLFDKKYGITAVYLEGAYGQLDTSWLSSIGDRDIREKVLDSMLESGRLTGAEYYSAISGRPKVIKGLENEKEYLENLRRFGKILGSQDEINLILNSMSEDINGLKETYYNRQQKKIEELSNEYAGGRVETRKYFTLLYKHTDRLGIDVYKYENIDAYKTLFAYGRNLDYKKVSSELNVFITALKDLIPYQAYKLIVDNTANFSEMDKLYVYLIKFSKEYKIDLDVNFPNLNRFLNYVELSQKINPLELIKEEKKLVDEINEKFSVNPSERNVVFMVSFQRYLKDFLASKITADDYQYYEANKREFRDLWVRYTDNKKIELLDDYQKITDEFYNVNLDRNKHFFDNIDGLKTVSKLSDADISGDSTEQVIRSLKDAKNIYVVITGGFHTEGLCEYLAQAGVSAITITPNVAGGVKIAEETYYQIAKEQSEMLFNALATLAVSLLPADAQKAALAESLLNAVQRGELKVKTVGEVNLLLNEQFGRDTYIDGTNEDNFQLKTGARVYSYDKSVSKFVPTGQIETGREKSVSTVETVIKASKFALTVSVITAFAAFFYPVAMPIAGFWVLVGFSAGFAVPGLGLSFSLFQRSAFDAAKKAISAENAKQEELAKSGMTQIGTERPDFDIFREVFEPWPQDLKKEVIKRMLPSDALSGLETEINKFDELHKQIDEINNEISKAKGARKEELIKQREEKNSELAGVTENLFGRMDSKITDDDIAAMFDKTIHLNYRLMSKLSVNLREVFIRHELRHARIAEMAERGGIAGKIAEFVHNRPALEEIAVSFRDVFNFVSVSARNWFASLRSSAKTSDAEAGREKRAYRANDKYAAKRIEEELKQWPDDDTFIKAFNSYMADMLKELFDANSEYTIRQQDLSRLIRSFKDIIQLDMGKGKQGGIALAMIKILGDWNKSGESSKKLLVHSTKTEGMSFRDAEAFLKMVNSSHFQQIRESILGKDKLFAVGLYHGNIFSMYDGVGELVKYNSLAEMQKAPNFTGLL